MPRALALSRHSPVRTFGIAAAGAVLFASGIGYASATEITRQLNHVDVFGGVTDRPSKGGGENILLIGNDDRTGISREDRKRLSVGRLDYGSHAEPILILHIADSGAVDIVSIPRDSVVEIPSHVTSAGQSVLAQRDKINASFEYGGPTLTVRTVEHATGVRIDHYAQINFLGFEKMVDAIGGVAVCLKAAVKDRASGLDLPAGETVVDGQQGLAYVRARHFDASQDLGRIKRQQAFLGSIFNRFMSPSVALNPLRVMSFTDAAASSITTDEGFDRAALWNLMARMRGVSPSSISFQTVPLVDADSGVVDWDPVRSGELFAKLNTGESVKSAAKPPQPKADPAATAAPPPAVEVAPKSVLVRAYNGSTVSGLGTKAGKDLKAAGFYVIGTPANWKSRSAATIIQYDPRYDTSVKTLQAALPGAQSEAVKGLGKTFRVIVGNGYTGLTPVTMSGSGGGDSSSPSPDAQTVKTAADDICS